MKKYFLVLASISLIGCASANFSKTGHFDAEERAAGCDFAVYTTQPRTPYEEVGLIEFSSGPFGFPNSLAAVKAMVSKDVCKNGGNALLLWEANGVGGYIKATVISLNK